MLLTHGIIVPFCEGHNIPHSVGYCLLSFSRSFHNLSLGNGNSSHAILFINRLLLGNSWQNVVVMRRLLVIFSFIIGMLGVDSCASLTSVSFLCNESDVQIYVNDDYVGEGLVSYTFPKTVSTAEVICKRNGNVIYTQTYSIKGRNRNLIEIQIPKDLFYSSDRQNHSK